MKEQDKIRPTFWVRIYLSGPIEEAKKVLREECLREGLCVTIEPTLFIYTGGEETGFVVQLVNYPRFPVVNDDLWLRAVDLARLLRDRLFQHSVLIMSASTTQWLSVREQ